MLARLVTQKVLKLPAYQNAQSISIFLSMPKKEVSTTEVVRNALHHGKRVFIPYIHRQNSESKAKVMDMLRLKDEEDLRSLEPDAWGIPSLPEDGIGDRENALGGLGISETNADTKAVDLDLIFMPGMAFDQSRNRLGHGGGFYDQYLSQIRSKLEQDASGKSFPKLGGLCFPFLSTSHHVLTTSVGLALREQLLPSNQSVPVNNDDWKIDQLITADDR